MGYYSTRLLCGLTLCTLAMSSLASAEQEDVAIGLSNVFVPKGFDSNDNVEIVVAGELPNTCYLRPRGDVKVSDGHVYVEMRATKITDPNTLCITAIVPYMVTIPLASLGEGAYDILVNSGLASELSTSIQIDQANSSSINNFTYANVTNVDYKVDNHEVTISGVHPSSCMEIDRVEIIVNQTNDTFSVLPILKQTLEICDRMIKPFSYTVALPKPQKNQELVHIRKIDGTALNYLVNLNPKPKN